MTDNRLSCFALGMTFGAGVSLLFAPRPGRKTRRLIAEKATHAKTYIERRGTAVLDSATDVLDEGKKSMERANKAMTAAVEAGKRVLHVGG